MLKEKHFTSQIQVINIDSLIKKDYAWHPSIGNYCMTDGTKYLIPYQELHIEQIKDHKVASEILQKIYTYRYGYINPRIGVSRETDIRIATNMGVN